MLRHTFCHLQGLGESTERRLWHQGITDWDAALAGDLRLPRVGPLAERIAVSRDALEAGDWSHFGRLCSGRHAWRWFGLLRERTIYLDIETTGLAPGSAHTTVVAGYDGHEVKLWVRDQNLYAFPSEIAGYDLLVTYNGARFDVPFLLAEFGRLPLPPLHLDLMYPLRQLGFRGGLKAIERQAELPRDESLAELDGFAAVLLWRRHLAGDRRALPALLRYAAEDVVGLEPLAEMVYNRLVGALPIDVAETRRSPRRDVALPFDPTVIEALRPRWP